MCGNEIPDFLFRILLERKIFFNINLALHSGLLKLGFAR